MSKNLSEEIKLGNDVTIFIEAFGDKTNEPVLLLHGAGNSMLNWHKGFCEKLSSEGYYVIRMDSRDAGRSKKFPLGNPGYEIMDLVHDVIGVLDHLNIQKINTVGVSQGSAVTQLLGIHYPERMNSICLISSTPGGPGHATNDLPSMTSEIAAIFNQAPSEPDWRNKQEVVDYLVEAERPFAGSTFDEEITRQTAADAFDLVPKLANQLTNPYMIGAGHPWRTKLKEISVPALIVHGSEDPFFPVEHGKALSQEIPNASLLVIKGMGHANIPRSAYDVLIKNLKELIQKAR